MNASERDDDNLKHRPVAIITMSGAVFVKMAMFRGSRGAKMYLVVMRNTRHTRDSTGVPHFIVGPRLIKFAIVSCTSQL